ncbi:hypothetical protein WS68_04405 [Burkholderia sp. TSV86]|nr:hypothetical protein WS68_04405 [Burkholderia sp. TSV86]
MSFGAPLAEYAAVRRCVHGLARRGLCDLLRELQRARHRSRFAFHTRTQVRTVADALWDPFEYVVARH